MLVELSCTWSLLRVPGRLTRMPLGPCRSFVERMKDTLKISGVQVSPTEIENVLLSQPDKLVTDVCVAGVPGVRSHDEKVPRAWVVLSEAGVRMGDATTVQRLDAWVKQNLSSYKWLRGGIEIVDEVSNRVVMRSLPSYLLGTFRPADTQTSHWQGTAPCPPEATRKGCEDQNQTVAHVCISLLISHLVALRSITTVASLQWTFLMHNFCSLCPFAYIRIHHHYEHPRRQGVDVLLRASANRCD